MAVFNVTELKNKAARLANDENQNYIVIPKSGAVRPLRSDEEAWPACLNMNDRPIVVYKNCQWCWQNGLSL